MKTETLDLIAAGGSKVTVAGGIGSAILTYLVSNFIGLIGLLIALLGFLVNFYYKSKANRRRQTEFERNQIAQDLQLQLHQAESIQRREYMKLRMEILRAGGNPGPLPADFGALAPAAGPWTETQPPEVGEDSDGS